MGKGWANQPLSLLAKIRMIDMVNSIYEYKNREKSDWSKFSPVENAIIRWLDSDG